MVYSFDSMGFYNSLDKLSQKLADYRYAYFDLGYSEPQMTEALVTVLIFKEDRSKFVDLWKKAHEEWLKKGKIGKDLHKEFSVLKNHFKECNENISKIFQTSNVPLLNELNKNISSYTSQLKTFEECFESTHEKMSDSLQIKHKLQAVALRTPRISPVETRPQILELFSASKAIQKFWKTYYESSSDGKDQTTLNVRNLRALTVEETLEIDKLNESLKKILTSKYFQEFTNIGVGLSGDLLPDISWQIYDSQVLLHYFGTPQKDAKPEERKSEEKKGDEEPVAKGPKPPQYNPVSGIEISDNSQLQQAELEPEVIKSNISTPSNTASPTAWVEGLKAGGQTIKTLKDNLIVVDKGHLEAAVAEDLKSNTLSESSLKNVAKFAQEMMKVALAEDLKDLHDRLIEKVDKELADEIMTNWDLIGKDVQSGQVALQEDRKKKVIDFALAAHQRAKFHDIQQDLKRLKEGAIKNLANEELIKQHFPNLISGLQDKSLSAQRQWELSKVYKETLNTAIIEQVRREPAKFVAKGVESEVIAGLGYNQERFLDGRQIQDAVSTLLDEILKETKLLQTKSGKELQQEIDRRALDSRLDLAGVEPENRIFVKEVIRQSNSLHERLNANIERAPHLLGTGAQFSHPQFFQTLKNSFNAQKQQAVKEKLDEFIRTTGTVKGYPDWDTELTEIVGRFENSFSGIDDRRRITQRFQNQIQAKTEWYVKYKDNLVHEFVQGLDDPQTILLEGCCYAISTRLMRELIKKPNIPLEELSVESLPIDRFNQASYQSGREVTKEDTFRFKKKYTEPFRGIRMYSLFEATNLSLENLKNQIRSQMKASKIYSSGVMEMGLFGPGWGHATFLQIDSKNGYYRVFDPNVGLLDFKPRIKDDGTLQSPEEMVDVAIEAYRDLVTTFYSDLSKIVGSYPSFS